MEETGFIFDKLIMFIAGVYVSFIWPKHVKEKVEKHEIDAKELDKFKWLKPVGILLITVSIALTMLTYL